MSNDIQVKKRIKVVKENMLSILRQLANRYQRNEIKSPAELQHLVYRELQEFYQSIGQSTLKVKKAWGPPYSEDHNNMMKSVLDDLHTLHDEIALMTEDIQEHFEQIELERQGFSKQISEIETHLNGIRSKITENYDTLIFREDFTNIEKYKKEAVRGTPAHLSTDEGILTLSRTSGDRFNEYATITMIKGNGLPGNTHIVKTKDGKLTFDGEENLHINLSDILDGNSDTWFEYEKFQMTERGEFQTENKNVRYKEPIYWMENDLRSMNAVIQIELPKAKNMNWVSMTPFIPSDRGALPATIEKVVVSDGKGTHNGLTFEEAFDKGKAFVFPRQECKTITLYLRQDTAYPVDVGHFYFKQIDSEAASIFDVRHEHDGIRVHGVDPSITNLGINYDTGKKEIVYPIAKYGDTIENESKKRQELFTAKNRSATGEEVFVGLEKVPSFRYVIGMRDIVLANYEFSQKSEYVSEPFISSEPIRELSMNAYVDVPESFPDGDWVHYYISIDEGQKWHEIHPQNTYRSDVTTRYLFNSKTPKQGRLEEFGYIESATDIYEVQLKIILGRPESIDESKYYTPVVHEYEIHAIT